MIFTQKQEALWLRYFTVVRPTSGSGLEAITTVCWTADLNLYDDEGAFDLYKIQGQEWQALLRIRIVEIHNGLEC